MYVSAHVTTSCSDPSSHLPYGYCWLHPPTWAKLTTYLNLLPRLRMSAAIPPLPPYNNFNLTCCMIQIWRQPVPWAKVLFNTSKRIHNNKALHTDLIYQLNSKIRQKVPTKCISLMCQRKHESVLCSYPSVSFDSGHRTPSHTAHKLFNAPTSCTVLNT
jgi:hypothetical protein